MAKIIWATDFSPPSQAAGRYAADLARKLGDTLLVAHIVEPPTVFSPEVTMAETAMMQALVQKAESGVKAIAAELRRPDLPVEERCLIGPPAEQVSELADSEAARLVVVGTHGRTALGRFFVGSVAERVVRRCRRPVLVVPPPAEGRPERKSRQNAPLKIAVALERGSAGASAVELARSLASAAGSCEVTFLHLFSPMDERERLGVEGGYASHDTDADIVAILERELRPMIATFPNADKVALRIQARRLDDSDPLGWAASLEEADLLVIGAPSGRTTGARALDSIRAKLVPVVSVPGMELATMKTEQPLVPWRSILAATDLSPGGNAAVAEAYRILAGTGGRMELCLVEDPDKRPLAPEHWVELQKQLWRLVPPAAERQGIVTRASIVEGRISAERILQAAERLVVDAIVLGVGHRTAVSRALLGSVADEVVLASSRPKKKGKSRGRKGEKESQTNKEEKKNKRKKKGRKEK